MDKKTILRVFGEAFLRSMVVLMAIAIIGFSAFFIIKVNADKKVLAQRESTKESTTYSEDELHAMLEEENANDTKESTTEGVETTEEATTEVQKIPSTDKNILILNGTSVAGLAGAWMEKLNSSGFANTAIGNYDAGNMSNTKIYVTEDGMGEDLLEYFSGATVIVDSLDAANYTIKGGVAMNAIDIIIVVGANNSTVQ